VRERVQQELAKRKDQQDVSNQRAYSNLYKNNIDNDHNSVALKEDIEGMIEKLKRLEKK
jgi:hypothetical protein